MNEEEREEQRTNTQSSSSSSLPFSPSSSPSDMRTLLSRSAAQLARENRP